MTCTPALPSRGLYAITSDDASTERLVRRVEQVLLTGPALLQYRNKTAQPVLRLEQAHALRVLCTRHGVPLIINDDVALALAVGADGVHLGADDGDTCAAREALGGQAIIGVSCYDDLPRAHDAMRAGASYVAFGAFFPSPTKPLAPRAQPQLLTEARALGFPCAAIGGITPESARTLVQSGANWLAVISGLFDAPDPAQAARNYLDAFKDSNP